MTKYLYFHAHSRFVSSISKQDSGFGIQGLRLSPSPNPESQHLAPDTWNLLLGSLPTGKAADLAYLQHSRLSYSPPCVKAKVRESGFSGQKAVGGEQSAVGSQRIAKCVCPLPRGEGGPRRRFHQPSRAG
jgi:hypothetical protein